MPAAVRPRPAAVRRLNQAPPRLSDAGTPAAHRTMNHLNGDRPAVPHFKKRYHQGGQLQSPKMENGRTIFDEPHHQSLEVLAAQALADGNAKAAFRLADRRCRILPLPEPHCFVLRGEASFKMGAKLAAIADIEKALEISPQDIIANRRMFAWAAGLKQKQAALTLIAQERNRNILRNAIRALSKGNQKHFANITILKNTIEGWAVWRENDSLAIMIADEANTLSVKVEPDPFHFLAEFGHATDFCIERPHSITSQTVSLSVLGNVFFSKRTNANNHTITAPRYTPPTGHNRNCEDPVTVIVPIFADYDVTRLCLESLLPELGRHRALLIDDASPDRKIKKIVTALAANPCIDVLINTNNLGFIGSVNRALEQTKQGDVILLNSDTIVRPGFIERLADVARSSPDIGTITPLSNNGEFTSFPIPNIANPLELPAEIERIDKIAAAVNADKVVDIPSGIGFCLYITRACLDSVSPLSEDFTSGYLEDTDFCLRAREQGFRNVCAPSVYVGHAGSRSFRRAKRSLVVRNLRVLEHRFPTHRSECAAFMAADPLLAAREAIERLAVEGISHPRLLVTGAGTVAAIARERARNIMTRRRPIIILEIAYRAEGTVLKIVHAAGGVPQSLQFVLTHPTDYKSLLELLQRMGPSRIEFHDPANLPSALADLLLQLRVPYDIFIADAGLLEQKGKRFLAAAARLPVRRSVVCHQDVPKPAADYEYRIRSHHWRNLTDGAQHIFVPCARSEAFARTFLPRRKIKRLARPGKRQSQTTRDRSKIDTAHIGFVPVRSTAYEQALMGEVARKLNAIRPDISITVVGATIDDMTLMGATNTFVTGAVAAEEFGRIEALLGLTHLFACTAQPLFGHPLLSAVHSSLLPIAYFDWSGGRINPSQSNASIDPRLAGDQLAGVLSQWIPEL